MSKAPKVSLRKHIIALLKEADRRNEQRFEAQQQAIVNAREAAKAESDAAKDAVEKAAIAADQRYASLNEIRGTLSDQAVTFARRPEVDIRFVAIESKLESAMAILQTQSGRGAGSTATWAIVLSVLTLVIAGVGVATVIAMRH